MTAKLNLDQTKIDAARAAARTIAQDTQTFVDQHTTVTVERAVIRLLGVDGVNVEQIPLPNIIVDAVAQAGRLSRGASCFLANAMLETGLDAQTVAERVASGRLDLMQLPLHPPAAVHALLDQLTASALARITTARQERERLLAAYPSGQQPWLYVIVATGNIHEDVIQAKAAARAGADIIAVIRTTGQSLLDYVPYGLTTEGFGGTYATQANFALMRQALDEVSAEVGRYIRLVNYCSGLCMPEIAAMGAVERLDMMLNDALYGILFRDINMQRTLVDQFFSRLINAYAGIIINTGEDNYLTTADALEAAHTVLASQFINEQLGLMAGLRHEQLGLGHAFEIDPNVEDSLLWELAQAAMARQIFPEAPLKYMPPTKHMTGDIFQGYLLNGMFNLVGVTTGQGIQLLGMLTEAIHTPFLHDRFLALQNARYVTTAARHLGDEIVFKPGGRLEQRADQVLGQALELLTHVAKVGLMAAIEQGLFADVKRSRVGGKGLAGVVKKAPDYYNPLLAPMFVSLKQQAAGGDA
mgnify:FL=1